jgi:uncharacterized protein YjiS (DUF1127 family)
MHFSLSCTAANAFCAAQRMAISALNPADEPEEKDTIMLLSIIRHLQAWRRYGHVMQELSHLSDRELADMGITRSDIPRVAWGHPED